MRTSARTFVLVATVLGLALAAPAAWAFWTAGGGGTASAATGTLAAPGTPNAAAATGSSTVHVTWAGVSAPGGGTVNGYYVERFAGAVASPACASSPSALLSTATCNDVAVPDGTYTYRVTAVFRTWSATSAASGAVVVAADTVLPTATITFPADGSTSSAGAFAAGCTPVGICGGAADNASGVAAVKVSVRQGTGNWWGGSAFDQGTEFFAPATLATPGGLTTAWSFAFVQPPDGTYTVHVQASDAAGNAQTGAVYAASSTFTVDSAGPAVTLTSVNGSVVTFPYSTNAASLASLGGACGTAPGDSATVAVAITGAGTQSGTAPCTAGAWTYTVSPALTAQGTYSATATQTDAGANTGSSGAKSIVVDRTAPAVALSLAAAPVSSFLDGSVLRYNGNAAGSFKLVATVTDAGAGPVSATFPVQSTSGWAHAAETVSTPAGGPFTSATFTFTNSAANPATYTVTVTDGAGNTSTAAITFDDDANDPSGSITAPADNAFVSGAVNLTANATDTGGAGVASTQFQVATSGGSTWTNIGAPDTTSPYGVTWASTGVADGAYDLRVVTTDRVGRTDTSGKVNVDVQNTAPTPTAVVLQRNGGTAGRAEQGDQVIVTYSQALKVSSLYSGWPAGGDRSDQSITTNGVVSVAVTDGGAGNDTLTVTTSSGTFNFGTVNLGAAGYVTGGSMAFGGSTNGTRSSVAWNVSSRTLTITLGAKTGTGSQGTVAGGSVATYTPSAAITNAALVPISGSFTTGGGTKF